MAESYLSIVTRTPSSDDLMDAKTAFMAASTSAPLMEGSVSFSRQSMKESMMPDFVWLALVWICQTSY